MTAGWDTSPDRGVKQLSFSKKIGDLFPHEKRGCEEMNPHFFTAPFYFAFIWFTVQGSRGGFAAFLEEGILVSQPSPLGNAIKLRKSLAAQRLASPFGGSAEGNRGMPAV